MKYIKPVILPVVLYRFETFSFIKGRTQIEVFENRVQRIIFGPKSYEVTGS
jgi:hypothetical protein